MPDAPGVFGNVAFIQRLDTRGGVAPASCTAPSTVSVDYSANYVFWAPKPWTAAAGRWTGRTPPHA